MGLGLSVLTEKFGVTNRNLAYISYAYRIVTGKKSSLRLGLQAGLHNQVQRFSELKTNNDGSIDPLVMQNTPALNSVNFGAGAYYSTPTFYAGLSVPRMIDDQVRVNSAGDAASGSSIGGQAMHYYFTLGNMFRLSEDLGLKAQAMMKSVKGAPAQLDVNANFLICKTVWLGAGYRNNAAVTAFLGLQPNPRFFIGYSYDYDLGGLQKYTNGSHEIVLSYLFYHDLKKVLSPRYF
jgi:type IX secretion system PorP/SprF family membrane protein